MSIVKEDATLNGKKVGAIMSTKQEGMEEDGGKNGRCNNEHREGRAGGRCNFKGKES